MQNKGFSDYQTFIQDVLKNSGVSMCARSHFGTPLPTETSKYLRLAYSGIDLEMIEEGLGKFKQYLEK
jgi:aspartate/methionine/tyrosine aminotransferase